MDKKKGRPKIKDESKRKILQTVRLSRYVVEWLDHQPESSGEKVEEALIMYYKIGRD